MNDDELLRLYRAYLDCLNARDLRRLHHFVHSEARHNGNVVGVVGYAAMLTRDFEAIPDLAYSVAQLVVQAPFVAARLAFDCTPAADFLGLRVDGRRVRFGENVFYEYREGKIVEVWSVVDKAAIEAQLPSTPPHQ